MFIGIHHLKKDSQTNDEYLHSALSNARNYIARTLVPFFVLISIGAISGTKIPASFAFPQSV
jgi:hypothetical protein